MPWQSQKFPAANQDKPSNRSMKKRSDDNPERQIWHRRHAHDEQRGGPAERPQTETSLRETQELVV